MDDITKMKSYLLNWINYYKLQGYGFCNIKEMIFKTISDECIITYTHYITKPMHLV